MVFIFSESGLSYIERLMYKGAIGIFYSDTLSGILAYILFAFFSVMAFVGILCTLKAIITGIAKKISAKRSPYKYYNRNK